MALISGYFDDSETTGELLVLAGYVGYVNQWERLERLWDEVLKKHGVPYFHMREMADPNGVFAKWHPPEDHQGDMVEFFKDIVSAIRKCGLYMFSSAVWLNALQRYNQEYGLSLEPYALAA